ncbi:MAG: glycosyltransferase 9 family protein [Micavibrio aeruginosavorus]|uniref:Glycosyltransferase 9 family protein n=1 Tax=Micavibrio aeruginosavorus TaxID=349221 RepID=A0A2W5N3J5_9BACT|nr:MAG: glycosyltransferase 9 family protein [Micavibrio aeruginosavorus]
MNTPKPRNILVIKLGALGDFIQALGPMRAIRKHHPHDRLVLLTTAPFESLAEQSGYFDDILLDRRPKWHDLSGWIRLRRQFNFWNFARVYDLQNNDRTALYLKLFSPKPEWVGAAKGASHRNASPDRNKGLAFYGHVQTLGIGGVDNVNIDMLDWMSGKAVIEGLKKPYVLIVPGSAANRPEKRWPANYYGALSNSLLQHGYQPVLLGGPSEADVIATILKEAPDSFDLSGKTSLEDLASLARGAKGAIGNDTGPMHIIGPTGCKTIVLFSGASMPHRHSPLGSNIVTLQENDLKDLLPEKVLAAFLDQ